MLAAINTSAPSTAVLCIAPVKAERDAARSASPTGPGSACAAATAAPSVADAAAAASGGVEGGMVVARLWRYSTSPKLPNTAMPSAPLNSDAVSARADAAPARSSGAALISMSLATVNTGARPRLISTVPTTIVASP